MHEFFLSVIIPAFNEEGRIESTLKSIVDFLNKKNITYEIIVVNDGSVDKTSQIVSSYLDTIKNLHLISFEKNLGKGAAVCAGMLKSTGLWRIFTDADNATPIEELDKLLQYTNQNDIVIGSIATEDAEIKKHESFIRSVSGKIGNRLIRYITGIPFLDTQRGFKLFSAKSANAIFPYVQTTGWGFDIEVLALAQKMNFKIKEVGVKWTHKSGSKVGPLAYFQVLFQLTKIRGRVNNFNELGK
ncbi:MAG: hypothetical protein A2528_00720 [Candidatus Staskawiczbacteria bacterium RIFOXYD2_FULL_37_9]|nr:MAG: hypothetical protein UT25_C0003G0042 [Parcubacteria group bacterium GW2011_GWC1_39_12]KKR19030.1 MAG: hypothetical protein UT49_C0004G0010 [Parcubacteria group bacterium GW2011_GWF1_39_37]KKR35597.1 MAG: hypothetical protein UT68_C0002G0023 [Parcubacteria group bacterium GW2011_GWC2_40_10]KKR52008.1 MAG: hypothetical protein UT89_C0004G0094 [Parcubacteria group bacterium GW2011_GWE1_40_20]KKR66357.1 MAG: hypothetical protein UU06_C0002G0021 [Parcubacteria group bacterium GW2011_GWB1_40_